MAASKRTKELWTTYKGRRRQVKSCGIREPKNRVKGYRVEIRPPNSKTKIWVGTFATRAKAMRAFDAAVYLIGKEPYYHIYPVNYFPRRPPLSNFQRLRATVQAEAKKYSEKNDHLPVNPLSLLVDTSTCARQGLTIPESVPSHQPVSMDTQVNFPTEGNAMNIVEEMVAELDVKSTEQDEFDEFDEFSHTSPCHDHLPSTWPHLEDLQVQESMKDDEAKVPAAYLRGLNAPNPAVVNALLDAPPLESFNVFPYIEGEDSILDLFEEDSSSKLISFKRECVSPDALADHFNDTRFSSSTFAAMLEDYCTSVGDEGVVEDYEDHPMEEHSSYLLSLSVVGSESDEEDDK